MSRLLSTGILITAAQLAVAQKSPVTFQTRIQKGIEVVGRDSLFSMQFQFRMQNRAAMLTTSDKDLTPDSYEFRVRRLRLKLEGFVYNPKLTYKVQLSFSRGDMDWDGSQLSTVNTSVNVVRDAVIYYSPADNLRFGFGQTKLPGNRQRVISSGDQQFADRSVVNATFTIDRDFGFFAQYGRKYFNLSAAVTSGEGRNSVNSNNGLAYTGRVEVLPFGKFTGKNDYVEGDLEREGRPKVSVGLSYCYNQKAVRAGGQLGGDLFSPTDMNTASVDVLFKYRGFSWYNEFMQRAAATPITFSSVDSTNTAAVYAGYGFLTQMGYLFKNNWEVAVRYAEITPFSAIFDNPAFPDVNEPKQQHIQAGVTKYVYGHRVKVQGNLLYNLTTNMRSGMTTGRYGVIFQIELGI